MTQPGKGGIKYYFAAFFSSRGRGAAARPSDRVPAPLVSLGADAAPPGDWQGLYLPETRAVTLRLLGSDWQPGLSADQLAPGNMRTLGLDINLNAL